MAPDHRLRAPPRPPRIRRRIGAPFRLALALAVVVVLPLAAAAGFLGSEALTRVVRVLAVFGVLLVAFRVIGKRELSRLSPFELVTLMLIPEIVSNAVQAEGSLLGALAGLSTLLLLVLATSVLAHRFESVEKALEPQPTVLVEHGRLLEDAMNEERIVPDELFSEMRKQGIEDLAEVRWAILESTGTMTFIAKSAQRQSSTEGEVPQ